MKLSGSHLLFVFVFVVVVVVVVVKTPRIKVIKFLVSLVRQFF